jgi:hypothetical protein
MHNKSFIVYWNLNLSGHISKSDITDDVKNYVVKDAVFHLFYPAENFFALRLKIPLSLMQ